MGEQFKWNPSTDRAGQMLRQAVYMEDVVTLEHLAKQKVDLEARDESGATPLHIAAIQCLPNTISWLLKKKADVNAIDGEGFSALTWACAKGHRESMSLLIAGGANITDLTKSSGKSPLAISAERGHIGCVQELLAKKADVHQANQDGTSALMCAAHRAETEVVLYLLDRNAASNATDVEGWTPLIYALNAEVAPRAAGGENADKKVILDGVLGKRSTIEILMLHKADVNARTQDGLSPLIVASGRDRPSAAKKLLEAKAEVNLQSSRGQFALLMAAAHNLPDTLRALVVAQADVNMANAKNDSPLSLAEKYNYKDIVDLLTKAGAVKPKAKKKSKKK
eukprot:TRINITY_DN101725_c0_g1_i1.p1 TRINITY_DN101725_c0_g1~~TRINITY_DN101725_c0_g1_i1.p1  ORF type:complete len:338 (-),score=60.78 TRINITY_DN101725_c0_g1_i1:242-1255(-)